MSWTSDFVSAARAAETRAASETCECGTPKAVGYSNLGIPVVCCPNCQPTIYGNRDKPVGAAWGFQEAPREQPQGVGRTDGYGGELMEGGY